MDIQLLRQTLCGVNLLLVGFQIWAIIHSWRSFKKNKQLFDTSLEKIQSEYSASIERIKALYQLKVDETPSLDSTKDFH